MRSRLFVIAGLAFAASGLIDPQPVTAQTLVALSGNAAPAGGYYSSFPQAPVLNSSGQVAFQADLSGGSANAGTFAGTSGLLQAVALQGSPAPAGGNYNVFNLLTRFNASGQAAFESTLSGGASNSGIFVGVAGSMQALAIQGTAAPAGGNYSAFAAPVLNDAGQVAFLPFLTGGSSTSGIFVGVPGSLQTEALQGAPAPAGGNYVVLNNNATPVLNGAGQVAFTATLTSGSSTSGIFVGAPGSIQAAALQGNAAPAGGNFSSFVGLPVLNGAGQVAFQANLTGGSASKGIFVGAPGSLQTVALLGNAAPAGGNFSGFNFALLNGSGQVAVLASLTGGTSSQGLFLGAPGALQTVALQGTAAPAGGNFDSFINPELNRVGQVAFTAGLIGGTSNQGLFAGLPGNLVKVVLAGDVINVASGSGVDDRTVSSIGFTNDISGGQDGRGTSINDSGLLVYELTFTDGSSGIFTYQITTVPEPTYLLLLACLAVLIAQKSRRKARRRERPLSTMRCIPITPPLLSECLTPDCLGALMSHHARLSLGIP